MVTTCGMGRGPDSRRTRSGSPGTYSVREVQLVADFLEGVDGCDARVRQSCRGPRFEPQAVAAAGVVAHSRCQRLERHAPRQPRVVGKVDDAHATAAQLAPHDVGTDHLAFDRVPGV